MGSCYPEVGICRGEQYRPGPMALLVDQLVERQLGYDFSHLDYERVGFVSEKYLVENNLPARSRKSMMLTGKKNKTETRYYFQNARALATVAKEKAIELDDRVIAVLFRDGDGTASAGRGLYQDKVASMQNGFAIENYQDFGVPMMPNPKSEAWLLCAIKQNPYQHCHLLEQESGNDNAHRATLKEQLEEALRVANLNEPINELIKSGVIDVERIDMPSFNQFKEYLEAAVSKAI